MKDQMKHRLARIASERPYRIIAASALAVAATSAVGLLAAGATTSPEQEPGTSQAAVAGQLDQTATGAKIADPVQAVPSTTSASPSASASASAKPTVTAKPKPKPPAKKVLTVDYEAQNTYYNCGPAATRNALTVRGINVSQDTLAVKLNTTENGTNSAADTTRVLNSMTRSNFYRTRFIEGAAATSAERNRLQADVVNAVSKGYGVVANVAGSANDTDGGFHSFPGGHYIAVIGYADNGRTVRIADSADPSLPLYWMNTTDLANWIAQRGYSA